MELNNKVENFYNKHRSNIILASHTQRSLESILRDLFQEMYELGYADGRKPTDEDIKSCIAMCLTDANEQRFKDYGTNLKDCLAWLGKKGEKKTADKVKPKFKIGDYLVNDYCKGKVIALTDDAYLLDTEQGIPFSYEHNANLWTIQDAKDGDVLACENGWTCIFRCLNDNLFSSHCFMDSEGWFCEYGGQGHTLDKRICGEIHPATKKQRELLFKKMNEAGYEWDAENKELKEIHNALEECEIENIEHGKYYYCIKDYFAGGKKQASKGDVVQALRGLPIMALGVKANEYFLPVNSIKQKTAWSEEDELHIRELESLVKQVWATAEHENDKDTIHKMSDLLFFLKTLKPHLKQEWSEEDENAIKVLMNIIKKSEIIDHIIYTDLLKEKLYDWLKSIKERVQPQSIAYYNPYKEVIESIDEMCKHYDKASHSGLRDFYDNVKVKCKDAKEYDSLYPQNTWKPSDEQMKALKINVDRLIMQYPGNEIVLESLYKDLKKLMDE